MTRAAYRNKELSLALQKKGIEAHRVIRFEKGGSWYNNYTLYVATKWLRKVYIKISKNTFLWGYRVSNPNGSTACLHASVFNTPEEANESAVWCCVNNLI